MLCKLFTSIHTYFVWIVKAHRCIHLADFTLSRHAGAGLASEVMHLFKAILPLTAILTA